MIRRHEFTNLLAGKRWARPRRDNPFSWGGRRRIRIHDLVEGARTTRWNRAVVLVHGHVHGHEYEYEYVHARNSYGSVISNRGRSSSASGRGY